MMRSIPRALLLGTISLMVVASGLVGAPPGPAGATTLKTPVVLILMENHSYTGIIGNADAPYINAMGPFGCGGSKPGLVCGTLFTNFWNPQPTDKGSDGNQYPSLPAYIEMTSANLSNFTAARCGGSLSPPNEGLKEPSRQGTPSE